MKPYHHLLPLLCGFIIACSNPADKSKKPEADTVGTNAVPAGPVTDTAWHDDFLNLQKVLAASDKEGLKKYISFPVMDPRNEIWHLVDVRGTMNIPKDKAKPFTEADYEKYHRILFGLNLPPAIKTINASELFANDSALVPESTDSEGVKTILDAKFDTYALG